MLLRLVSFIGEVPKLPGHLLPESAAQYALDCDFAHGELRGLRDGTEVAQVPPLNHERIVSVWTEDGAKFFGWPWEVDVVKSQVVGDIYHRICYTGLPGDGPIIKVARTARNNNGALTPVIGNDALLGNGTVGSGNFRPPETTNVGFGGNNLGPDAWFLGIPAPQAQNVAATDALVATLLDRVDWPSIPRLRLRVTLFFEDTAGKVVFQQDVSNNEFGYVPANPANVFANVFYTNAADGTRGSKIQDMMFPLTDYGTRPRPAPYKYYWCDPPSVDTIALSRTATVQAVDGDLTITFSTSVPAPVDSGSGGSDGNEA